MLIIDHTQKYCAPFIDHHHNYIFCMALDCSDTSVDVLHDTNNHFKTSIRRQQQIVYTGSTCFELAISYTGQAYLKQLQIVLGQHASDQLQAALIREANQQTVIYIDRYQPIITQFSMYILSSYVASQLTFLEHSGRLQITFYVFSYSYSYFNK